MILRRLVRQLPVLIVVVVAGFAIAQGVNTSGGSIPYVGHLERGGEPVDGSVAMQLRVYTTPTGGAVCDVQDFDPVDVVGGNFAVELEGLADACLSAGALWLEVSVGDSLAALTDLAPSAGGRTRLGAVPFAAATPLQETGFVNGDLDVDGDLEVAGNASMDAASATLLTLTASLGFASTLGQKIRLWGNDYGFQIHPSELRTTVATTARFTVGTLDANGNNWTERVSIEGTGATKINGTLTVTGDTKLNIQCTGRSTACNDQGDGSAIYLDRHNVSCPTGEFLNRVRLQSCGGNTMRYDYTCCGF